MSPAVTEAQVMAALGTVLDPEVGMSIVELGLVYGVAVQGNRVDVTMTLTVAACPIHDVDLVFDPPWTPERIRRR
jgi:metal-sulfur cluster biosynthetic enzyme